MARSAELRSLAHPLEGQVDQFDPILDRVGNASVVLIGEASHGTHDFYAARAELTRRLIQEKGFAAVVAEADWPDAYRVNRYVRGEGTDRSAEEALGDFERFPTWMWRNRDVEAFTEWLRSHNLERPERQRVGFYGMDLYSLYRSIRMVLGYLESAAPEALAQARERYACFDHHGGEAQRYGQRAGFGLSPDCEQEAIAQLLALQSRADESLRQGGLSTADAHFFAEQNARVVRNAEEYYRHMFGGRVNTWNLRDEHMVETCDHLRLHLSEHGAGHKIVVWAHNSHLGDARATDWVHSGQLNVGELMRERHGEDCVIIGFSTHTGTVTAADDWDGPAEVKRVRPSLEGSWERVLHEVGLERFFLITAQTGELLDEMLLNRAIGVIYRPQTERASHYYGSRLGRQYDVVVHYDVTEAVEPLERWPREVRVDLEPTEPTGL